MMKTLLVAPLMAGMLLAGPYTRAADLSQAREALLQGRVDDVVKSLAGASQQDGPAQLLLCRAFYAEEKPEESVQHCEYATQALPSDATAMLWLARAYGLKASKSFPTTAISLAKNKVRPSFERAAQLGPTNGEALSDLGQFYIDAPSFAGGAPENVSRIAQQLMPISAWRAHRLLAHAAEKNDDYTTALSEYQAAVAAGNRPETLVDLGAFYHRRHDNDKAVATLKLAAAADSKRSFSSVDVASILFSMHKEYPFATQLLREYLNSPARTDDAPAFRVRVELGELLAKQGDKNGAQAEYAAALALASQYTPARKAAQS